MRATSFAEAINLAASVIVFAIAPFRLIVLSASGPYYYWSGYVVLDMPGAWVILCTAIVYLLASIYAVGYMRLLEEDRASSGASTDSFPALPSRSVAPS